MQLLFCLLMFVTCAGSYSTAVRDRTSSKIGNKMLIYAGLDCRAKCQKKFINYCLRFGIVKG